MKKLVLLILLASAVSFAQQPAAPAPSKAKILTRAEFDALLAKPGSVLLLDVRRPTKLRRTAGSRRTSTSRRQISKSISPKSPRTNR